MSKRNEKPKFSNLRLRSNKTNVICSPHNNEKISSYFPKLSQETNSQSETISCQTLSEENCPEIPVVKYKFTSALDASCSEATNFKNPQLKPKKQLKLFEYDTARHKRNKSRRSKSNFKLAAETNGICDDVNVEHLQMALAMSHSLQTEEVLTHELTSLGTQQKVQSLKKTLEQFGFKSDAPTSRISVPKPATQRKKKIRFLTSVLMSRTDEDRTRIIERKVSEILTNIKQYNEYVAKKSKFLIENKNVELKPGSFMLRDMYDPETTVFRKCALHSSQNESYYNGLVNPSHCAVFGCLLRDWRRIPGREQTPPPTSSPKAHNSSPTDVDLVNNCAASPTWSTDAFNRSLSPELFTDDDSIHIIPSKFGRDKDVIKVPLSNKESSLQSTSANCGNTDIIHFESYNHVVSFDLTQSSENSNNSLSPLRTVHDSVDLTLSSEESRDPIENTGLNISKVISFINTFPDKCINTTYESNFIQTVDERENKTVTNQTISKDLVESEVIFYDKTTNFDNDKQKIISNDSKITDLLRDVVNNSQNSNSDYKNFNIAENCDVTDLIYDAVLSSPVFNETDVDSDHYQLHVSDLEEDSNENNQSPAISPQNITSGKAKMNISQSPSKSVAESVVTCISSDSEDELNDEELNYSSHQSFTRRISLNDVITNSNSYISPTVIDDGNYAECLLEEQPHRSESPDPIKYNSTSIKHPRLTDLCITSEKTKLKNMFNDTLEKILEENDPWAGDAVELPPEIPWNNGESGTNAVCSTPQSQKQHLIDNVESDGELVIKTTNVTPMANYNDMDTPQRIKELDKYGIKPMKRAKSVKILEYIYNATHPVSNDDKYQKSPSSEEEDRQIKRRKTNKEKYISNSQVRKRLSQLPKDVNQCSRVLEHTSISIVGDLTANNEDLIFERKQSSKYSSCRIPLHIAWHNYVAGRPQLLENMLLYEPLQLEEVYMDFKNLGFKFHIQDLITFLDKQCITVRTVQNNRIRKNAGSQK